MVNNALGTAKIARPAELGNDDHGNRAPPWMISRRAAPVTCKVVNRAARRQPCPFRRRSRRTARRSRPLACADLAGLPPQSACIVTVLQKTPKNCRSEGRRLSATAPRLFCPLGSIRLSAARSPATAPETESLQTPLVIPLPPSLALLQCHKQITSTPLT